MKLGVIGVGYVGLVTGACFAETGNQVICMDNNKSKINTLNKGKTPFYEPGLDDLVSRNLTEHRLKFTTDINTVVNDSSIILIAVGTPSQPDGSADLNAIFKASKSIAKAMKDYKIIVVKSTVPVGTTDKVYQIIKDYVKTDFEVLFAPEFLKQGDAVNDFMKPNRVIIGANDLRSAEIMKELHKPFVRTENPIIIMDIRSAEMTKYAANAMLATKISFMNEISNICDRVGADVEMVRKGIGTDKRIGFSFIFPGVGYGGSCFPKDIKALLHLSRENDYRPKILESVDSVNQEQRKVFYKKIRKHFKSLKNKKIAVWGLSFKPKTDDMRDAPSITIIHNLLGDGAIVSVYDPKANGVAMSIFNDTIDYANSYYEALEGADALVLITEWNEFRTPDFEHMKQIMKTPVIFDGRNIFDPKKLREMGFTYYGIGRP
ncbi:UDP-glucose/GDP-mannose dehydrogenase family protein [candidate division WOR-3 bacterium]|nr:UDP-glucose/GDP-mannose dehydrogenase family protein [candidate division WOR-3 bacterium]